MFLLLGLRVEECKDWKAGSTNNRETKTSEVLQSSSLTTPPQLVNRGPFDHPGESWQTTSPLRKVIR
ncbi:hypothetical protein AMEX_G21287 [Astyanax mexicanus]|uniref:Uncharacterized protein n=1 Tax=Astyanax mexicanus TaxID=7994 RepID=A0A8T2L4R7_ASTMX|nr:hypothetical protein AMEX_G21287 [Astyanax mexicanus]